jgi:hypothetical protein
MLGFFAFAKPLETFLRIQPDEAGGAVFKNRSAVDVLSMSTQVQKIASDVHQGGEIKGLWGTSSHCPYLPLSLLRQ